MTLLVGVAIALPGGSAPRATTTLTALEIAEDGTLNPEVVVAEGEDWESDDAELDVVQAKSDVADLGAVMAAREQQAAARAASAERAAIASSQAESQRSQPPAATSEDSDDSAESDEVTLSEVGSSGGERGSLASLVNGYRSQNGLGQLSRHGTLDSVAQGWAEHMASSQSLYHNPSYRSQIGGGWSSASEIIVRNTGATNWSSSDITSWMFTWWRNSAVHNGEMLRGDLTHFGVGYAMGSGGPYAVIVFGG